MAPSPRWSPEARAEAAARTHARVVSKEEYARIEQTRQDNARAADELAEFQSSITIARKRHPIHENLLYDIRCTDSTYEFVCGTCGEKISVSAMEAVCGVD